VTPPPSPNHHQALTHFANHTSLNNCPADTPVVDYLLSTIKQFLDFDGPKEHLTISGVTHAIHDEIRSRLENQEGNLRVRYEYDYFEEKMVVFSPPCAVHETGSMILYNDISTAVEYTLQSSGKIGLRPCAGTSYTLMDENGNNMMMKSADQSFKLRGLRKKEYNRYPCFVIEVGYSETFADLKRDASHWLWGSHGQVLSVLIVKFAKPTLADEFGDIQKWRAFMELYIRK
jgi:hypothetical protein